MMNNNPVQPLKTLGNRIVSYVMVMILIGMFHRVTSKIFREHHYEIFTEHHCEYVVENNTPYRFKLYGTSPDGKPRLVGTIEASTSQTLFGIYETTMFFGLLRKGAERAAFTDFLENNIHDIRAFVWDSLSTDTVGYWWLYSVNKVVSNPQRWSYKPLGGHSTTILSKTFWGIQNRTIYNPDSYTLTIQPSDVDSVETQARKMHKTKPDPSK